MKKQYNIPSLLDEYHKTEKLTKYKDPLKVLNERINWESFRATVEQIYQQTDPKKGGRPSYDKLMMFKILILQNIYELSDDAVEFQIFDRWSFMNFLGLTMNDNVPDAKTIWLFRETLTKNGVLEDLYTQLNKTMQTLGLILNKGRIIDATIMEVPKQRNTRQENKQIKAGEIPEEWKAEKVRQKDVDASWLTKDGKDYFGFKNHVVIDSETKLIVDFQVTPASVTDREIGEELIEEITEGIEVYADRGYPSERLSKKMKSRGITDKVMRKGSRNKAISQSDKERNDKISKTRCKIEHVFGYIKRHGKKFDIRTIGLERATAKITMKNIIYNLDRTLKLFTKNNIEEKFAIIL